jgi:hypothetical protein
MPGKGIPVLSETEIALLAQSCCAISTTVVPRIHWTLVSFLIVLISETKVLIIC